MASTPPPLPQNAARRFGPAGWRTMFLIPGMLLVLSLFSLVVWHVTWRVGNARAVRREEAAIRQRDEPLTLPDLARGYGEIPVAENAAEPLLAVWESESPEYWRAFRNGERNLPERPQPKYDPVLPVLGREERYSSRRNPLTAESKAAAETFLQENVAHMEAVRAALQHPRARFPIRIADGYDALLPHLPAIKREAQFFQIEALFAADRGETVRALAALDNIARLEHLLADDTILISQLVRMGCGSMLIDGFERLLRSQLSAEELVQAEGKLQRLDVRPNMPLTFMAERAVALSVFDLPAATLSKLASSGDESDNVDPVGFYAGMGFLRTVGVAEADRRFMLETFGEAIRLAEQGTPESLRQLEALFDGVHAQVRGFPIKIFSGLLLSGQKNAVLRFARHEARRRTALLAVAIERYRLEHGGRLPERLADLPPASAPELRQDPFTGDPLRFQPRNQGYVVYSVGSDRSDDGGREKPVKTPYGKFDETFIVGR